MSEAVTSSYVYLILLVVGVIVLVAILLSLFPATSATVQKFATNMKKPFCCDIMQCKSAANTVTNPGSWGGSFACTAFCAGVCG